MEISADMGHSLTKFYDGRGEPWHIDSVLGEIQDDLAQSNNRMEIETTEGSWYVGRSALKQSVNPIMGKDEGWAFSPEYRALLLYGISEYCASTTGSVVVDLVTSLPIVDYRRNRQQLTSLLQKTHQVRQSGRRDLNITIRRVIFLPQGFAPAKPYLATDRKIVTLDLGSRNVNYATFDGRELIDNQTDSREIGATATLIDISKQIEKRTKRELSLPEVVAHLETKTVRAFNQDYDVSNIIEDRTGYYIRSLQESLVAQVWGNAADVDNFIVFGGGALLAGEQICQKYPQQAIVLANPLHAAVIAQFDYLKRKLR